MDHPHFVSRKYPPLSMEKRAAQFSPFKAMVGYDEEVEEESRFTEDEIFIDENRLEELDERLRAVAARLGAGERPTVKITYFVPDDRKAGGAYVALSGAVRRIDEVAGTLVMADGTRVEAARMVELEVTGE